MEKKHLIKKTIVFLLLFSFLGPIFNFHTSEASEGYLNIYPRLSQLEKDEVSEAMYWLYKKGDFHYQDNYEEDSVVFIAMEQSNANFHNKNFEYYFDHNATNHWQAGMGDPLGAFEAYDKGESNGVDWYMKNFWNLKPTHASYTGKSDESYYHKGYYYKYYHRSSLKDEPRVKRMFHLGNNYYGVEYEVSEDVDWADFVGNYYAILKKKNVEGKQMWSAIYNQDIEKSLTLDKAIAKAFPYENIAQATKSKVIVNGEEIKFEAYRIEDNNYFKLRDIALILNGTSSNFEVGWDRSQNSINLISGNKYTPAGGELKTPKNMELKEAALSSSKIMLNNKEVKLKAYTIEGNNYFKLRDLGDALGFFVDWDQRESSIIINAR